MRNNCIVCEDKIYRSRRSGQLKQRRSRFALTCSSKCSRIYTRVRKHVAEYYIGKMEILKRKIKRLENEISKKW